MYGWEKAFEGFIQKLRLYVYLISLFTSFQLSFLFDRKELKMQSRLFTVNALNGLFDTDFPPLVTYVSISVFIAITSRPINPTYVVLVTSYYWLVVTNLIYFFMRGLIFLIGGVVSLRRVQVRE